MVPAETRPDACQAGSRSSPGSQAEERCPYASSVRSSALRGYNGSLVVGNDAVLIQRGLRGVLARKRRDPDLRIPFDEVVAVRFAPSGWLVGYLQVSSAAHRSLRAATSRRSAITAP